MGPGISSDQYNPTHSFGERCFTGLVALYNYFKDERSPSSGAVRQFTAFRVFSPAQCLDWGREENLDHKLRLNKYRHGTALSSSSSTQFN